MDSGPVTFEGNNNDMMAIAGAIVAVTVLLSCVPGGNCLVFFAPGILGLLALLSADQAVDPKRTRMYGWFGLGVSLFIVLMTLLLVALYFGVIIFGVSMGEFN